MTPLEPVTNVAPPFVSLRHRKLRSDIDLKLSAFLKSQLFVALRAGAGSRALQGGVLLLLLLAGGCSSRSAAPPKEESLTSGRIRVVCPPEVRALVDRQKGEFERLYPDAQIELASGESREAVRALFAAEADLAVLARELSAAEREAAMKGGLPLQGYRFAREAIVVIVHASNAVENVTLDDLRRVYQGEFTEWSDLGGTRTSIERVVQEPESDLMAYWREDVLKDQPIVGAALTAGSDSAVIAAVAARPGAIGFVGSSARLDGVRPLRLAAMTGLPYHSPDAELVYKGDYPLMRQFSFYARAKGPLLANGLITFATSMDGQRLVSESGLVPTSVPVRFVRRSPMLQTH